MTGREALEFLQTLDDEELECDLEIKIDYRRLSKHSFLWAAGIAVDCNGIYVCDENGAELFEEGMVNGDRVSWEVEQ